MNDTLHNFKNFSMYIFGDFNIDQTQLSKNNSICKYVDTVMSSTCKCLNSLLTRKTATSQTLIDRTYLNDPKNIVFSSMLRCDITDHQLIFTLIANVERKHPPREVYFERNMKKFNLVVFLQQLNDSLKALNMHSHKTVNYKFEESTKIFTEMINSNASLVTASRKETKILAKS